MQEINIIPRKYNIEIKPDINNHNFDGLICINFDTKKEINKIKTILLNSFSCKVFDELTQRQSCKKCSYFNDCSELIDGLINDYCKLIKNTLINDSSEPRSVKFNFRNDK